MPESAREAESAARREGPVRLAGSPTLGFLARPWLPGPIPTPGSRPQEIKPRLDPVHWTSPGREARPEQCRGRGALEEWRMRPCTPTAHGDTEPLAWGPAGRDQKGLHGGQGRLRNTASLRGSNTLPAAPPARSPEPAGAPSPTRGSATCTHHHHL